MQLLRVFKSPNPEKKLRAIFLLDNGRKKRTDFGAAGMDDYTLTKSKEQRERYQTRHASDLKTDDPTRAGYLAYYILWGPFTSIRSNVRAFKTKFNL